MISIGQTNTLSFYECKFCQKHLNEELIKRCSKCKSAIYCGVECQKQDWKAVHKKECKEPLDNVTPYTQQNEAIRLNFSDYETHILYNANLPKNFTHLRLNEYNHVLRTQQVILEGSSHLNPETSVVVVCGAQFYQNKFVEPLPQLLEKCKQLILMDIDQATLDKLHLMLGSSSKVSKVFIDLTRSLNDLSTFYEASSKSSPKEFLINSFNFLDKVTKETEKRDAGLPGVLTADYVISSLVASQLSIRLKETLFLLFTKKFNAHVSTAMTPQIFNTVTESLVQNIHAMVMKHVEDLCAVAGQKGRVYFADSYQMNEMEIISEKTLSDLAKRLGNHTRNEWHWYANQDCDYKVRSFMRY